MQVEDTSEEEVSKFHMDNDQIEESLVGNDVPDIINTTDGNISNNGSPIQDDIEANVQYDHIHSLVNQLDDNGWERRKQDIETATINLFKPYHTYDNKQQLKELVFIFAEKWGFKATITGFTIRCNRFGSTIKKPTRSNGSASTRKTRLSIKCGCTWGVNYRFKNKKDNKTTDPVVITTVNPTHTGLCKPSRDNLVTAKTMAVTCTSHRVTSMKELMYLMDINGGHHAPAYTIK